MQAAQMIKSVYLVEIWEGCPGKEAGGGGEKMEKQHQLDSGKWANKKIIILLCIFLNILHVVKQNCQGDGKRNK